MPYIASNPTAFLSQSVGDGQCVALVQRAADAPATKHWRRGVKARGAVLAPGTIIATFDTDGRYGNHTDGRSHAAIVVSQTPEGLDVIDQWIDVNGGVRSPHRASRRVIRVKGTRQNVAPVNDADEFYVVE